MHVDNHITHSNGGEEMEPPSSSAQVPTNISSLKNEWCAWVVVGEFWVYLDVSDFVYEKPFSGLHICK